MDNQIFHKVYWKDYQTGCLNLAKKIRNLKIDRIIAISRGGLVASRILSDLLSTAISHLTIQSYKDLKQQKHTTITEVPTANFKNQTLLIVDEIADSGKTFKRAIRYLKNLSPKKIYTLALYVKSHTKPLPDFWSKRVDAWIIFPYEIQETYLAFMKLFKSPA